MAKIECSNRLRVILAEKEITNRWLAKIKGISAKGSIETDNVCTAEIWFLGFSGQQKLILVNPDEKPRELEINADFNYDIE